MHFANVLTGFANQAVRNNVVFYNDNGIDPLVLYPECHDTHPKVDLDDSLWVMDFF